MEIVLIIFLIATAALVFFLLYKVIRWIIAKKARVFSILVLLLIIGVGYTINHLFFTKMEFIQSKVYPNLYLVKNEIEDRAALQQIIKKKVVNLIDGGLIDLQEIYPDYTSKAPYATLAFYTYNKNSQLLPFQDYGTAYFINNDEDLGGMIVEDLSMYSKYKLATYNLRTYRKDTTSYYGVLDYYKEGYIIKTDTLFKKTQKTTEQQLESPANFEEATETTPITSEFKSLLKPNETLKLGIVYTDTVRYVNFDDNGDDWLFLVESDQDTIGIIHNKHNSEFIQGETLEIEWKIDSLRPAGDPEFLEFKEFLISANQLSSNSTKNSFVISCGAGCAMTYTQNKIVTTNDSGEVTFKVEMYADEVLSSTYYETYLYTCDSLNNDAEIQLKGADNYTIENQHPEIQEKLKSYISKICNN